jgi:hypothetical protein
MNYSLLTMIAAVSVTGLAMATDMTGEGRRGHDERVSDLGGQYDPNTIPTNDGMVTPETPDTVARGEHEMKGVHAKNHGDMKHGDMKDMKDMKHDDMKHGDMKDMKHGDMKDMK